MTTSPSDPHLCTAASSRPAVRACSLESRRSNEIGRLIERHGGVATVAPSMREVPLESNFRALDFAAELLAGRIDVIVFLTGVGARALQDVVITRYGRDRFLAALRQCTTIVRGPKPAAVLREWKLRIDHAVPQPNTWRELLTLIDEHVDVAHKTVAVQEYGEPNGELYRALSHRKARVVPVPVYRWDLPADTGPLEQAIRDTLAGEFDLLLFTSAQQVRHALMIAERLQLADRWRSAAERCIVASIGPTASAALRECGLPVHVEATPPKMAVLVREGIEAARRTLSGREL